MTASSKILQLADQLTAHAKELPRKELSAIEGAAANVGRAWSGSWLGYQARVYYKDLQPVPPGARFSMEWGLMNVYSEGTHGHWQEFDFTGLVAAIKTRAGIPDFTELIARAENVAERVEDTREEILSLLSPIAVEHASDNFLKGLLTNIEDVAIHTSGDLVAAMLPTGQYFSRDMVAMQAGFHTPPHFAVLSEAGAIRSPYTACTTLSKLARRAASHVENLMNKEAASARVGTNVFIGHGRSRAWRDLKDFVQDRLHLPWDEFNRVPVAGFTNIARLSQMLDSAAVAFIVLTAEDELADGTMQARMNVIHEAGLFQGRLGFEKAILLLEEGCEEFSNVQGLGQIRFPAGDIFAKFEDIRRVLEREGLVDGP